MNNYPLFEKYPDLEKNLPFVSLGIYPTPVQELKGLSDTCSVYIKRDDLSGEEYGGNKVRKLEYALGEAKQQGYKEVLTFGCDGSNHALATGIYAKKLGMQSHSILRTQHNAKYLRQNLLKSLYYGIRLYHCEDLDGMNAKAAELQEENMKINGRKIYEVPVGGSNPLGTVGFVNAAFELKKQVESGELPEPDYIYATAGTLGTVAGLTIGLELAGMKTKVLSIQVNGENRINVDNFIKLMDDTVALMHKADASVPVRKYTSEDVHIIHDFFGGDYALFTPEGMAAISLMKEKFGITLDGTYTGKTCAALLSGIKKPEAEGKVFVFWNTLNSRPAPKDLDRLDYHNLPAAFHRYFETNVQELDR